MSQIDPLSAQTTEKLVNEITNDIDLIVASLFASSQSANAAGNTTGIGSSANTDALGNSSQAPIVKLADDLAGLLGAIFAQGKQSVSSTNLDDSDDADAQSGYLSTTPSSATSSVTSGSTSTSTTAQRYENGDGMSSVTSGSTSTSTPTTETNTAQSSSTGTSSSATPTPAIVTGPAPTPAIVTGPAPTPVAQGSSSTTPPAPVWTQTPQVIAQQAAFQEGEIYGLGEAVGIQKGFEAARNLQAHGQT